MTVDALKVVIFSDLHLVPEGEVSNTLDTTARLKEGVAHFNAHHSDADLLILAGDLADLGEAEAYLRLADTIKDFSVSPQLMLGNHDDRPTFLATLGAEHADENGFVQKVLDVKGHRVILLDSTEPGLVAGRLCETRLSWLRARLAEAADRPVIVVLHHHVVPLRTNVDRIILENSDAFLDVLSTHKDIRQVIMGHVHVTTTGTWRGIHFTTLKGGHYGATIELNGGPVPAEMTEGPAQYATVLSDAETTMVHFENYIDRHVTIARENFFRLRPQRRPAKV